jgi:hypothetical protein
MLVVGTRGRSLGGLQGLVNTRNSFSKYCLQYSPVPVVVVRPNEKREKKKNKRQNDLERQTYIRMLTATNGKHEADSEASSMYELEAKISPDEEAHRVAKELGLPAAFDPTIKPVDINSLLHPRHSAPTVLTPAVIAARGDHDSQPTVGMTVINDSPDTDEEDDDEEFEVMTGAQALNSKKVKLHEMEVGEAAALLKSSRKLSEDSGLGDQDDD